MPVELRHPPIQGSRTAAAILKRLRDQRHVVFLHSVAAQSQTPTVAARHGVLLGESVGDALARVVEMLPTRSPSPLLLQGLRRLGES